MNKGLLIFSVLVLLTVNLYSQDTLNYASKWLTRPSIGFNIPLTTLLKGDITDNLFEFDDHSTYWQVLSVTYFFHKRWGVEFNFQGNGSSKISNRDERFLKSVQSEYGNEYFVTPSTGATYDSRNLIGGNIERGYLGLIYRIELKRLLIYPKLAIGVTSFYTDWGQAFLKLKGSNTVLKVDYSSGKRPNDHFTVAPSLTIGYKLTKRVFFNIDIMTSYYKTDITFTKSTTDLNTGQGTIEKNKYRKNIYTLSLGTGLIIVIK